MTVFYKRFSFLSVAFLVSVLTVSSIRSADTEAYQQIALALEMGPKILHGKINVGNYGKKPITVSVEGVNLCAISAELTSASPLQLPFETLSSNITINENSEFELVYRYNIQPGCIAEKESLLLYPRLHVSCEGQHAYFRIYNFAENYRTRKWFEFAEKTQKIERGAESTRYIGELYSPLSAGKIRFLHFKQFCLKHPEYNKNFLEQCEKHVTEVDEMVSSVDYLKSTAITETAIQKGQITF